MEEETSSWVRRAKLSETVIRRSNSTRESLINPNSSSKFPRDLNFKSFSLESKPRSFNLDRLKIPLPKPFVQEPQSSKLDTKPELVSSQSDYESKNKEMNVSSNSDVKQKPKPSSSDTEAFSFYPDASLKLSSKWSDATPTPPTPTLITKSSNFSFHNVESSRWLNSSNIPMTPSFKANSNDQEAKTKRRSLSPLPTTILSDVFHEAKSIGKRFSTPPRKKNLQITTNRAELSPMKHLSSLRAAAADKLKRDRKVNAVDCIDEWMIDLSKLFLGLRFAAGAHSKLYHGMYNDKAVAVKIIRQPEDDENGLMATRLENQFVREVSLLSQLRHPNVIKLIGACKNPPVFCVITEYLSGGSLKAYLHKYENKSLPLGKLVSISLEIAKGMEYIHSQGVVHRDLKPENILFDQDSSVKIADFGIASNEKYCNAVSNDVGTYRWMAPEMIKHKSHCRKVDVYSFGLLLWEMVTGRVPYEDMTPIQAAFAVVNKKLRPVIPDECPSCLRALMEQCWASVAEKRPEFWQIVKFLEHLEVAISKDGSLDSIRNLSASDHKKLMLQWMNPKIKHSNVDVKGTLNPRFL